MWYTHFVAFTTAQPSQKSHVVSSPLMPLIDCKLANTFVEQELMIISRREALKYLKRLHSKVKHVRICPVREKMGARVSSDPLEQNQSLWNTGAGSIPHTARTANIMVRLF